MPFKQRIQIFGFLWLLARERLPAGWPRRILLIGLTLPVPLIGFSRVSLGAHWPSDTLGAYLWSGVWLGLIWEQVSTRSGSAGVAAQLRVG